MIKLITIMEGTNEYFYHATTCEALPGIVTRGLLPSDETHWGGDLGKFSEGKVFLTNDFSTAVFYGNAGIWGNQHFNCFRPILRVQYDKNELMYDQQSKGDYYSEIPIRGSFEIFVPSENDKGIGADGLAYYNEKIGTWRSLTKDIAESIATGEWDGEIIDDKNSSEV